MVIKKLKTGEYRLYSLKTGRNLGTFKTKEAAQIREKQVEYFKRLKRRKSPYA